MGSREGGRSRRTLLASGGLLVALATVMLAAVPSQASLQDVGAVQASVRSTDAVPIQFAGIDAGESYSIGWTPDGALYTWGTNANGVLGDGSTGGSRLIPERVVALNGEVVIEASAGINTAIALTQDGEVFTWGNSTVSGTTPTPTSHPFFASLADPVVGVSSGGFYYLAWTESGALYSWGDSGGGRLGRAATGQSPPARVTAQAMLTRNVEDASAGRFGGAARVDGGSTVIAWGNLLGAASGSIVTGITTPPAAGVTVGSNNTLVWTASGDLFHGTTSALSPVAGVTGVVGAAASVPSAGISSFYAWTSGGQLFAWGANAGGQLGLGTNSTAVADPTLVPLAPGSLTREVGAGAGHALYLGQEGTFASAGSNGTGQLGTGNTTPRNAFGATVPIYRWP